MRNQFLRSLSKKPLCLTNSQNHSKTNQNKKLKKFMMWKKVSISKATTMKKTTLKQRLSSQKRIIVRERKTNMKMANGEIVRVRTQQLTITNKLND